MLVTVVTTWFPTDRHPAHAPFVVRDAQAIQEVADVTLRLVHLIPPRDLDGPRRIVHDGLEVLRIPFDPQDPRTWRAVRAPLSAALRGSDLVHSMAISSLIALRFVRVPVPWVHTEHWSALTTPSSAPGALRRAIPLFRRLLRRPDLVTAVVEFLARPIREERGARPVAVVPCIVDPIALSPRRPREDGRLNLFSTGSLIARKDPHVAVRTVAELRSRGVDAHLHWLGDGPERESTQVLARDLGVEDGVHLHGFIPPDQVMEMISREADIFFGPTRADNFFVGAAEAILAGRPVVLGATGGQGEYVDARIGELIEEQDPTRYADALLRVDERTRELSSEEIAATIGTRFSSATVGELYRAAYGTVL
ncbi:glycosyltransferase [Brachybacterium hainanense]|uniref:Glycosyltransferase n=1 Tax=Brachybacterium hainanense TaxID=1541174 RepID=A0ABV6RGH6_9MICO